MATPPMDSEPDQRARIEERSQPLLVRLSRVPRFVVPLGTLLLIGLGFLAPLPIAIPALIVVFVFVGWVAYLSWPAVDTKGKAARVIMMIFIVLIGLSRFRFLVPGWA